MALGSPGSDSEEEEGSRKKQTHNRRVSQRSSPPPTAATLRSDQFLSSRRFSNENNDPPPPHKAINSFSPGKGDWSQATMNASSLPLATLRRPSMNSSLPIRTFPPRHVNASSPYQQNQVGVGVPPLLTHLPVPVRYRGREASG
jgi:hypothetical protein